MDMLIGLITMKASEYPELTSLNYLQMEALKLCARGLSNCDISDEMKLSENAIAILLKTTVRALDATNIRHAVAIFVRNTTTNG